MTSERPKLLPNLLAQQVIAKALDYDDEEATADVICAVVPALVAAGLLADDSTTTEPVDALAAMRAAYAEADKAAVLATAAGTTIGQRDLAAVTEAYLDAATRHAAVVQAEQSKRIADAATEINDNLDRIASLLADRFIDAPLRRAHTLEELQAELAKTRSDHDANLAVMAEMGPAYEALEAVVASVVERLDAAEAADQRGELAPKWTDRRVIRDELRGALEGGESRG